MPVVAGSVVADRVLAVLLLAGLSSVGDLYFGDRRLPVVRTVVLGASGLGFMLAVAKLHVPIKRFQKPMDLLLQSTHTLLGQPGHLVAAVGITVADWLASIVQTQLSLIGLELRVPFAFTMADLPAAAFVELIPVTFSSVGTRHSAMVLLFSQYAGESEILTTSLLYTFFGYWLLAIGGLPWVRRALRLGPRGQASAF